MVEETKVTETVIPTIDVEAKKTEEPQVAEPFKFFKNCSGTLKKLSVAVFVVNLFIIVICSSVIH